MLMTLRRNESGRYPRGENEERQDHRNNLTLSHDAFPLIMYDLDDALVGLRELGSHNLTAFGDTKGRIPATVLTHSWEVVPLKMSNLDDALVRAAGDDASQDPLQFYRFRRREEKDPRYSLTHSCDTVPLKMSDLDDTLVSVAGDDERQDPCYNIIDSVLATLSL